MSDMLAFFGYLALVALCSYYGSDIAHRIWGGRIKAPSKEWRNMVEPIVKKCRLSATFNGNTTFTPDGSTALASLLERMATELDHRS